MISRNVKCKKNHYRIRNRIERFCIVVEFAKSFYFLSIALSNMNFMTKFEKIYETLTKLFVFIKRKISKTAFRKCIENAQKFPSNRTK